MRLAQLRRRHPFRRGPALPIGLVAIEFGEKVDEHADLCRHELAARIDCVHRDRRRAPVLGQDDIEQSGLELIGNVPRRAQADSEPGEKRLPDELARVGADVAAHAQVLDAVGPFDPPCILRARGQAIVGFEVGERSRRAAFGNVFGARAHDALARRELAGDEARVLQFTDADGKVETVADDVDVMVREMDIELDLGVLGEEQRQVRRDVPAAEGRRRRHLQDAARLRVAAGNEILRLVDEREDVYDTLEVALSRLGQSELAGRALEEPGPELLLE